MFSELKSFFFFIFKVVSCLLFCLYLAKILLMFSASFSCKDLSLSIFSLAFSITICCQKILNPIFNYAGVYRNPMNAFKLNRNKPVWLTDRFSVTVSSFWFSTVRLLDTTVALLVPLAPNGPPPLRLGESLQHKREKCN